MVDTNSDPTEIDFPIPANDDASKSISLITDILCEAIEEGLNERKLEKDKEPGTKDKKIIRKELETKDIPASLIEAIVEEEEDADEEEADEEELAGDASEEENASETTDDDTEEEEEE